MDCLGLGASWEVIGYGNGPWFTCSKQGAIVSWFTCSKQGAIVSSNPCFWHTTIEVLIS